MNVIHNLSPSRKQAIITIIICTGILGSIYGGVAIWGAAAGVTGSPLRIIASESMTPSLQVGDVVILHSKAPETIVIGNATDLAGDVIVFNPEGIWSPSAVAALKGQDVVHRVIDGYYNATDGQYYFKTKGDANAVADPGYVPADHICGVVDHVIPYLGLPRVWLSNPMISFPILFMVGGLLVAGWWYDHQHKLRCQLTPDHPDCKKMMLMD